MTEWIPLVNLLYSQPAVAAAHAPAPAAASVSSEPATAKQKAFLSYMGLPFGAELSKEAASQMVNEAMENPRDAVRLARWNVDRLKLHPDLFSAEIQARKEGRSQHFLEICETEGAEYFTKVTKAHCQVLVGYLDVKFPNWDADEQDAAIGYFFPAIAEKFPQLLTKAARGKFKYSTGQKIAREHGSRSPVVVRAKASSSMPVAALARGVFFGALILGMLWFVKGLTDARKREGAKTVNSATESQTRSAAAASATLTAASPTSASTTIAVGARPSATNEPPAVTKVANAFEATPAMDPGMGGSEMTPVANTTPSSPEPPASASNIPLFTPDPAPGGAPASATAPLAHLLSSAPAHRNLVLTKPFETQLTYGKVKLPAGTALKLVQRTGPMVKVSYLNNTFVLPASSTDIGNDPGPLPVAAPNVQASVASPSTVPISPASDL
jgi:hypothetical protein